MPCKIFVRGRASDAVKGYVSLNKNHQLLDGCFSQYPHYASTLNSLRFLIPEGHLPKTPYLYITDADMLMFDFLKYGQAGEPFYLYYRHQMRDTDCCAAAVRGAIRIPPPPKSMGFVWDENFRRAMGGYVMVERRPWYKANAEYMGYCENKLEHADVCSGDVLPAASYREFDEVMLARMCKNAGVKLGRNRGCFGDGTELKKKYRFIHLGIFRHRLSRRKIDLRIDRACLECYVQLRKTDEWKEACDIGKRYGAIRHELEMLDNYMKATL